MRATIIAASVVALLATGAGPAAGRPADMPTARPADVPTTRIDADAMRSIHADALRYQAEAAYYRHHKNYSSSPPARVLPSADAQDVARGVYPRMQPVPPSSTLAPAPVVHVARLTDGGFDWADAGIGAGLAAALLLSTAGASALRRQHPAAD